MAKQRQITYQIVDDIDGELLTEDSAETIIFAFAGKNYEIDLSHAHAAEFRQALAPYLAVARGVARVRRATAPRNPRHDFAAIRQWASEHGIKVAPRGRIAKEVLEAYDASQSEAR